MTDFSSKIRQIKALREEFPGLSLKEAKDIVEGFRPRPDATPMPPPAPPARPHITNQWGQMIELDDIVAYVSKTGSTTDRRIGVVVALTQTKIDSYPDRYVPAVKVEWKWEGSYCDTGKPPVKSGDKPSTIRINNVFKLQPSSLSNDLLEAFC